MLDEYAHEIEEVVVVPSSGGVFEVTVDGEELFSKKALGRHAEAGEVLSALRASRA